MKRILFFFCLLLPLISLFGQRKSLAEENFKVFLDADLGSFYNDGYVNFEVAAGIGYRFSELHSAGVEYRRNNRASCCNIYSMQGAGAFFRYKRGRLAGKISGGPVFEGTRTWDGSDIFEYKNGGQYFTGELKYYFHPTFRAGIFYTRTRALNFDYYIHDLSSSTNFTFDRVEKISYPSFGISIGATLPPGGS